MTRNYDAFTLAEVLITLVIVGVIAAMTIPTLMNNTNKQELVSKLKKTYSTMAQATNRIITDEGNPRGDIGGWAASPEAVYNMYKKYLNKAKDCGSGSGCFESMVSNNGYYKNLNGGNYYNSRFASNQFYRLILSDGAQLLIADTASDCSQSYHDSTNGCSSLWIDINGEKKPNQWGRDIFIFILKEDGLYPAGCEGNSSDCNKNSTGYNCACKVFRENAMNY